MTKAISIFPSFIYLVLGGIILTGCASATVLRWSGQAEFDGKGGAYRTIDGIDFYTSGEPAGRYKILSVMQGAYRQGGMLTGALSKRRAIHLIINEARNEGADAAIITSSQYHVLGASTSGSGQASASGAFSYSGNTTIHGEQSGTVALVKYIDVKR